MCTRTIFRGKDMSMSTKNIHETFYTCSFFSQSAKEDIGNFGIHLEFDLNRIGIIERGRGVRFNCCGVVGCTLLLRTCTHTVTRTRHTQLVQEWPLIGWKNARSRVCRRRVCEVMVSTSFYGLARARTVYLCAQHPPQPRSPLCAPCKTHTTPRACYFASAPTDSLDRSWKQQITTRVQLDKRNRFSIPDIPEERSRDFVL